MAKQAPPAPSASAPSAPIKLGRGAQPAPIESPLPEGAVRTPEWPNGIIISPHTFSAADEPPAPEPDSEPDITETE